MDQSAASGFGLFRIDHIAARILHRDQARNGRHFLQFGIPDPDRGVDLFARTVDAAFGINQRPRLGRTLVFPGRFEFRQRMSFIIDILLENHIRSRFDQQAIRRIGLVAAGSGFAVIEFHQTGNIGFAPAQQLKFSADQRHFRSRACRTVRKAPDRRKYPVVLFVDHTLRRQIGHRHGQLDRSSVRILVCCREDQSVDSGFVHGQQLVQVQSVIDRLIARDFDRDLLFGNDLAVIQRLDISVPIRFRRKTQQIVFIQMEHLDFDRVQIADLQRQDPVGAFLRKDQSRRQSAQHGRTRRETDLEFRIVFQLAPVVIGHAFAHGEPVGRFRLEFRIDLDITVVIPGDRKRQGRGDRDLFLFQSAQFFRIGIELDENGIFIIPAGLFHDQRTDLRF